MQHLPLLQEHVALLKNIQRGIEREAIRINSDGQFDLRPHSQLLGSALTHAYITTDYSESLLELITDPHKSINSLFQQLQDIHTFVLQQISDQCLWSQSMPCHLPDEKDIPIAEYGCSNSGKLRHVYRQGLAVRYGKKMQCIAGLHYNFSLPDEIWTLLDFPGDTPQEKQNNGYMALIRNFKRYAWLLMYLFGASPAVNSSFLNDTQKAWLSPLLKGQEHTYHLPHATSLRMSDLGYKNDAQSNLKSCFNDLPSFAQQIYNAVTTPWSAYEKIGTHKGNKWIQLNTNVLQIENEFYATIRPKRTHGRGERPITALLKKGIQYIEVRCIDIDPFEPLGISAETCRFLDAFLLFCAMHDSPLFPDDGQCPESDQNFNTVVTRGREPELMLKDQGKEHSLQEWGLELIELIRPYSELLASLEQDDAYIQALHFQINKLNDVTQCPSDFVVKALIRSGQNFNHFFTQFSEINAFRNRRRTLPKGIHEAFVKQGIDSLRKQFEIEASDLMSFDEYVQHFMDALTLDT